jgi:hypothetical protein
MFTVNGALAGDNMGRVIIYSIFLALFSAITVSGAVLSSAVPDNNESPHRLDTSNERTSQRYHLVTLPSTNRKRVDAMCIRFLSLIPKAMLIPKTEERTVYRLVANTFDKLESAKKRKVELSQHGIATFVIANDSGYSVIAGSHFIEALALEEQKILASKNITSTILELRLPLKQWLMKSTESFAIRDAVNMAGRLAKTGVITTLEPAAD